MKLLSLMTLLLVVQPSFASLFGEAGHGDTQEICAYNQSSARLYKPQSVINAEAKLKVATDKQERLEKKLDRLDCSYCEDNFRKVISIVDKDNYNEYIRHLEGGSACSTAFNNVDVYNHWAEFNNWEKIELYTRPKSAIRNIAGGCPEGETCGEPPEPDPDGELGGGDPGVSPPPPPPTVTRPEVEPPEAPPGCPYYAGPNYTVKSEACEVAKPYLSNREHRKCLKCIAPRGKRSYGKCLRDTARLEEELSELEEEIEELELDLEDAIEDAEESGEEGVCADCMKDNRSTFSKLFPTLLTGAVVGGASYLTYRSARKDYKERRDYHRDVIHPDNNAKGYPTSPFNHQDTSFRNAAQVGLLGLPLVFNTARQDGLFGCSAGGVYGDGTITSGAGAGAQVGGATGLSGVLAKLLGGLGGGGANVNGGFNVGGNTNGVTTGQGVVPPGYVVGANGQLIFVGNNGGVAGQPTLTTAQIDAQIRANQAQLAQLNAARTYNASYSALTTDYYQQLNALGPNPTLQGNIYGQQTSSGVLAPSSNSVVSGGVSLNLGAQIGAGTVLQPTFPGQIPTTTVPIGGGVNPVGINPAAPPITTQPTGINRLIND